MFHHNYEVRWKMYNKAMENLFKKIPTMRSKPLSHNKKHKKLLTYIGGGWYMEKNNKGIPPLRKQKLSKKAQKKYDKIECKIHNDNRNWSDWKLKLHWKNLELVNPIIKTQRKKTYSTSSKQLYIYQDDIMAHWVGHSLLK